MQKYRPKSSSPAKSSSASAAAAGFFGTTFGAAEQRQEQLELHPRIQTRSSHNHHRLQRRAFYDGCFSLCFGFRLGLILGFGLQGVESEAKVATTNPLSPGFNEAATSTWPSEDNLFTSFSDQSTHAEETAAREAALALPEEAAASVLFEEVPLEASLLPEPLFSGLGVARPKETADALRSSMLKVLFFTGVATISMPDVEEISSGSSFSLWSSGSLQLDRGPKLGGFGLTDFDFRGGSTKAS